MRNDVAAIYVAPFLLLCCTGCWTSSGNEVIVYAALDREFSEPILTEYQEASGVEVLPKYDVESTKTVQLVAEIIGERGRPRCDLFWNNEILHTLRLEREGLLEAYQSPLRDDFPTAYRSEQGLWYGIAARARVLIVNTDLVPPDRVPTSIVDLVDPSWKDQIGIAKPLFGTTATHAAVLFSTWGDEEARDFFTRLSNNAQVLSGNKQVAAAVGRGQLAFGLTDTDDAIIEVEAGRPVEIIFPDQKPAEVGTLFIPNTLCLIKGSPNGEQARELLDYLLSPEVEISLARGPSAQIPVSSNVDTTSRAMPEEEVRWMDVDFEAAADKWDVSREFLIELFASS